LQEPIAQAVGLAIFGKFVAHDSAIGRNSVSGGQDMSPPEGEAEMFRSP
jgi:hypothetical protein